jgi:hypothetical protein
MLFAGIAQAASAPAEPPAQASVEQAGVTFTAKSINSSAPEYEARITYPVISGLSDKTFESQLNAQLHQYASESLKSIQQRSREAASDAKKSGWEMRPYVLDISYSVHTTGKLLSFSLNHYEYTGGAHGLTNVSYYNIANLKKGKILELSDLFQPGYDYRGILSMLIRQQIAEREQQQGSLGFWYNGIAANQPFSFQNGELVIHFGQYEIAPYAAGMPSFVIPKHRYSNLLKPEIRALLS